MGSRGASTGWSIGKDGKRKHKYGTEFSTVYESGNIKFVKSNSGSAKTPMETMTRGRVYVTINADEKPKAITYYDKHNKRMKQIDLTPPPHVIDGNPELPHTHKGYIHDEKGTRKLTPSEEKMVERVQKIWQNRISK